MSLVAISFYALSLVGIYPGRASLYQMTLLVLRGFLNVTKSGGLSTVIRLVTYFIATSSEIPRLR